jgi:uncharacterized protein
LLDILRGFALFGILFINMQDFAAPPTAHWVGWWNVAANWFLRFAGEGKFRSVYALLFGVGFALQLLRAKDATFRKRFVRRLMALLLIGICHYVLIWKGDVLIYYALTGFVLLTFANCSPRVLLRWVVGFFGITLLAITASLLVFAFFYRQPATANASVQEPAPLSTKDISYQQGSYGAVVWQRLVRGNVLLARELTGGPFFLALFLLGLAAGKVGLAQQPGNQRALLRRICLWAISGGVLANFLFTTYGAMMRDLPLLMQFLIVVAFVIGAPLLAVGYVAGLTLMLLQPQWLRRLRPLAAVGRLSLSNYLLQSIVCTTFFYGYGFGWYGKVDPMGQIGLTILLYTIQIPLSNWWLHHFQFGPIEWLWRSLTYGQWQPFRRRQADATFN